MNKEDFELLSLAAKAVGIRVISIQHGKINATRDGKKNFHWNPRIDAGDNMRLAVELSLDIEYSDLNKEVFVYGKTVINEAYGDNKVAATCLAVLRAAAEIGKLM